jgi:hypothetical protein
MAKDSRLVVVTLCSVLSLFCRYACADETQQPSPSDEFKESLVSFGPIVGFHLGNGAKLRVGDRFGLQTSAGAALLVIGYNDLNKTGSLFSRDTTYYVDASLRVAAIPFARVWQSASRRVELRVGPTAQFDYVLGWGCGGAGLLDIRLSKTFSLDLAWGASYFPKAEDRLISSGHVSSNPDFDFPPGLQWGADVGVALRL